MESKYVAFHISRKTSGSVVKETEKSASGCHGHGSRVGWAVGTVCVLSVVVNVVLLMMYIGLQKEVDRQKAVVDNINTLLTKNDAWVSSRHEQSVGQSGQAAFENRHLYKRSSGARESGSRRHGRIRRNARNNRRCSCNMAAIRRNLENNPPAFQYPPRPAVHLMGVTDSPRRLTHNEFITWQRPMSAVNSFGYEPVPSSSTEVQGLIIRSSGTYFIYSQVALNGKTIANTALPECGHDVIREREAGDSSYLILLRSIVTQDREGGAYLRSNVQDGHVYPLDTQLQAGLFVLMRGDKIRVRVSGYCRRYARLRMNQQFTYFGAFMVNNSPM
ncbi:uncharacterized protein LOC124289597 isoform X2 [Haliotis rubra]|uniref:uncharacterized protein LOC124289597 isoform X2 n=1 Tax=Haliotis rubra TaxID=36100 RepID=UPI001EE4FBB1|nr:uncharacterized protein LOC124289597 isoform X2 [Haliotis rubra]